jgi:hypothetical protein
VAKLQSALHQLLTSALLVVAERRHVTASGRSKHADAAAAAAHTTVRYCGCSCTHTTVHHQQLTRVVRNLTEERHEREAELAAASYADQCSSLVALRTELATLRSDNTDLQKMCQAVTEQRDMYRRLHAEELHGYTGVRSSSSYGAAAAGGSGGGSVDAAAAAASKAEAVLKERIRELEQQLKSAEEKAALLQQSEKNANDNLVSRLTYICICFFNI